MVKKKPVKSRVKSKASSRSKRSSTRSGRFWEIAIAVAFGLVVLYVVSVSVRVSRGVSKTLESPDHEIRLQVLNGCGENGLAGRIADSLADYTDARLRIVVVETDNFDLTTVEKSMIIARTENTRSSRLLAELIGLNDDEIIFRPLDNNYAQVTTTLVLGHDWQELVLPARRGP